MLAREGQPIAPSLEVRPVTGSDVPALKAVLDASGLFPSELLDAMIAPYFEDTAVQHIWLTATDPDTPIALAYCEPERMTEGTWNLLALGVHPEWQGHGVGSWLMRHLERMLAGSGQRVLLVETSSLPEYEGARRFYARNGYVQEARIRDFYREGEDKIVFWRKLRD